jgi:TP901 family phage tail tape measure protein
VAETFQLSVVYKAEDRAFLAALKRELQQAQKLEKTLTRIRSLQGGGQGAGVSGATAAGSGVTRVTRDYDRLTQSIRRAESATARLQSTTRRSGGAAVFGSSGPLSFLGRAVAPAALGYGAWRMGRAYDQQWTEEDRARAYMRSIGGSSQLGFDLATLGNRYAKNRTDLVLGGYQALSSGVSGEANVKSVVQNAAILSSTNPLASVEDSVKALTLVANAYAKNGVADFSRANMGSVADMLARTVEKGVIEMPDLTAQLGDPLSIAPIAGVSLKEVLATMGTMSLKGINAAEGATATKNLLNKIINPTDESRGMARTLGVDLSKAGLTKAGGLPQLMGQLVTAANKKGEAGLELLLDVFPELRAAKAALAGFSDPAMWNDFAAALDNSTGAAERMAAVAQDNLGDQLKIAGNNILDMGIKAGEASGLFGGLKSRLQQFNEGWTGTKGEAYMATANAIGTMAFLGMQRNPWSPEASGVVAANPSLKRSYDQYWAQHRADNPNASDMDIHTKTLDTMNNFGINNNSNKDFGAFMEIMGSRHQLKTLNTYYATQVDPNANNYGAWRSSFREGFLGSTGAGGKFNDKDWSLFNTVTDTPAYMQELVKSWSNLLPAQQNNLSREGILELLAGAVVRGDETVGENDPDVQALKSAAEKQEGAAAKQDGAANGLLNAATALMAAAATMGASTVVTTIFGPSRQPSGTGGLRGFGRALVNGLIPGR